MNIDFLLLIIAFLVLIIASLFDIKTREIPDWLNFSLIAIALSTRLTYAIITKTWPFFFYSLLALLIAFIIGSIMYYTKQWGGGDTKLLIGLSALLVTLQTDKLFLIKLIINILIAGSIYGLSWATVLAIKNRKQVARELKKSVKHYHKISTLILTLLLILSLFIPNKELRIIIMLSLALLMILQLITLIVKAIEKVSMYKKIPISKLTEGDWITKNIYINKKLIYNQKSPGVTKKQIGLLKKAKIKQLIIKEGIPFVPSFLLGFILTLLLRLF